MKLLVEVKILRRIRIVKILIRLESHAVGMAFMIDDDKESELIYNIDKLEVGGEINELY